MDSGFHRNDGTTLTLILPYTLISWKEEGSFIKKNPLTPSSKKRGKRLRLGGVQAPRQWSSHYIVPALRRRLAIKERYRRLCLLTGF
jgi:hypothetical protein